MKLSAKPEYWLVKLDERSHWRKDIQGMTKEMYGVYAFDRTARTFCCEITPSYELGFIANDYVETDEVASDEDKRDELNNMVLSVSNEPLMYMHVRVVESLMEKHPELFKKVDLDFDEDSDPFDQIAEAWGTGALMY